MHTGAGYGGASGSAGTLRASPPVCVATTAVDVVFCGPLFWPWRLFRCVCAADAPCGAGGIFLATSISSRAMSLFANNVPVMGPTLEMLMPVGPEVAASSKSWLLSEILFPGGSLYAFFGSRTAGSETVLNYPLLLSTQ